MLKRLVWAGLICAGLSGPALAHSMTKEGAECLMSIVSLANSARAKTLSEAALTKIQDLLTKLGNHCQAQQYAEAAAAAKDIKAVIESE